jgi:hypothetical protein
VFAINKQPPRCEGGNDEFNVNNDDHDGNGDDHDNGSTEKGEYTKHYFSNSLIHKAL